MAKIEPFPYAILLPDADSGEVAGLAMSVAAGIEEPDLRRGSDLVIEWGGLAERGHLSLGAFREADRFAAGDEPAIILATSTGPEGLGVAIYCRFPVAMLPDILPKGAATDFAESVPDAASLYGEVIRQSGCTPDPLVVAITGCEVEAVAGISELGRPFAQYATPGLGVVTLREVADKKQREKIDKLLVPGWLGTAKPTMVLEGPIAYCVARAKAGDSHVFACVIPVGPGLASLQQRELLVERLPGPLDGFTDMIMEADPAIPEWTDEDLAALVSEDHRFSFSRTLQRSEADTDAASESSDPAAPNIETRTSTSRLPGIVRTVRHPHDGTPRGMEYSREDWTEDQRIEAKVADSCGMIIRGVDEYFVHVGATNAMPLVIADLYSAGAMMPYGIRRSLAAPGAAINGFTRGAGHVALWPHFLSNEDATARILGRRPPMSCRRALIAHDLPIRSATVVMLGR